MQKLALFGPNTEPKYSLKEGSQSHSWAQRSFIRAAMHAFGEDVSNSSERCKSSNITRLKNVGTGASHPRNIESQCKPGGGGEASLIAAVSPQNLTFPGAACFKRPGRFLLRWNLSVICKSRTGSVLLNRSHGKCHFLWILFVSPNHD